MYWLIIGGCYLVAIGGLALAIAAFIKAGKGGEDTTDDEFTEARQQRKAS